MSVTHLLRATRDRLPRPGDLALVVVTTILLITGLRGTLPPLAVVVLAVGVTAAVSAVGLARLAQRPHRRLRRAAHLFDAGLVAAALAVATLPVTPTAGRSLVAAAGLLGALLFLLTGLAFMPGPALGPAARLRRAVDGFSLGLSLVFATWVLFPADPTVPLLRIAVLLTAAGLAVVSVTAITNWRRCRGTALAGLGIALVLCALMLLTGLFAAGRHDTTILLLVPPLVAGPAIVVAGLRHANRPDRGPRRHPTPSGYPMLTAPAVIASVAAVLHLLRSGDFDRTAVLLALGLIPSLVVRELLASHDIRRSARQLATQEAYFRSLVSGGNDLTLVVGVDLLVRWQSPAAARLFGLVEAEVVGRPFADLMHPDDAGRLLAVLTGPELDHPRLVTARLRDGDGAWRETESTITDQREVPEVAAYVVHVRDIGERRRLERTVQRLFITDQLTGLANRRELMRAIAQWRAVRRSGGALLVIDLHGMADANDAHGRAGGDRVLMEAARRMRAVAGPEKVIARLAGDEFAVAGMEGSVTAYGLGGRLLTALTEPYPVAEGTVRLQVSIGLAEFADAADVEDVLRRADLARRRARQLGRNRVEWYDPGLEERLARRLELERELPGAAGRGELDLVYQPVIDLRDALPVGTEAFLRWRSPALGTVLPEEVLPVAEDLGLGDEVGTWVFRRACRQVASWTEASRPVWMAVNVSPRELLGPDFVTRAADALTEYAVEPDRMVVEVAEPAITRDVTRVVEQLLALRQLGVRIALDDFGAAQASLAQLRRLPLDLLKVDRALLTAAAGEAAGGQRLIDVVVALGRRLGIDVIVEGLESADQITQARAAGCRFGQGFGLSAPAPAERVEAYLEEFPAAPR
ncbi:putative bifunctional diguanylate cyclase/phosphodiesterase [Melissospora conviva]|uniref:putative bifunctional diguanylate cyclase/phosphodiesterase n=1 Tax=Melissospora conviva TaxID=3388432 RepID=UPI003C19E1AD